MPSLRNPLAASLLLSLGACGSQAVVASAPDSLDGGQGGQHDAGSAFSLCGPSGCVCAPSSGSCENGKARACRPDGSGYDAFECDALQGMTCMPDGCKGACTPPDLGQSYIGCDYFPTVTLNPVWSGFDFAVAVANAGAAPAHVTVTRGAASVTEATIETGGLQIIKLPWVTDLKGGDLDACQNPPEPGNTRVVAGGAYRLRATVPVTVYQFSPLTYEIDPVPAACPVGTMCPGGRESACKSFSNDASLLLPTNVMTGNYTGLSFPSHQNRAGFLAVTATQDDTDIELSAHGEIAAGGGIDASGQGKIKLNAGDVLELLAAHDGPLNVYGADISGTVVRASHPVQVIGGHSCANVPEPSTGYCDHLEQALFPVEVLGKDYLVTFPAASGSVSPHLVRIAAVSPDTTVTFDPPVHAEIKLDPQGPPLELKNVTQDVRIASDKALLVAQYMQGSSSVPSQSGDPSMSIAVPTAQFRTSYTFVASSTYDDNFVNIVAPKNADILLDGVLVAHAEFADIGSSGYAVARHILNHTDVHKIASSSAFGIVVYGYGKDTSYMYPGGLDLKHITDPPAR